VNETVRESELVRRAQAGDTEAFGALVTAHQAFVYHLALRAMGDEREAEDAAQEAFVRAWLALPNFRGQARFSTWLYRIVTNLCCNRRPRLRRELLALGEDAAVDIPDDDAPNPAQQLELNERHAFVQRQVELLPESYRVLVMLRFQQELSYEEIASVLSLPLGTVKTGLFRARARLREALLAFEAGDML
jgi:RNA polymerase sigma-70 factor (ECF subfamily)